MASSTVICPKCKYANRQEARFCAQCRAPLTISTAASQPVTNPPATNLVEFPVPAPSVAQSEPPLAVTTQKYLCPHCKGEVITDVKFCRHCGRLLTWTADAPIGTTDAVAVAAQSSAWLSAIGQKFSDHWHMAINAFRSRSARWVAFVLLALALLFSGVWIWREQLATLFPDPNPATSAQPTPALATTPAPTPAGAAMVSAWQTEVATLPDTFKLPATAIAPDPTTRSIAINLTKTSIVLLYIPSGEFAMGNDSAALDQAIADCTSPCDRGLFVDELPSHIVQLDGFWMMKTELSNQDFRLFVDAGGYKDKEWWTDEGWEWRDDQDIRQPGCWGNSERNRAQQPVVCISWHEAVAYAAWLSHETGYHLRLPSEAQWEKAARGTDHRVWPWGNDPPNAQRLQICQSDCVDLPAKQTSHRGAAQPVGSLPAGASPFGVLDMAGNVWEWTADSYTENYAQANGDPNQPNSPANADSKPVQRGGSWINPAIYARTTSRNGHSFPIERKDNIGFRLVMVR